MEFFDALDEVLINLSRHEFIVMCYGLVLYFSIWYSITKDKFNAKDESFRFFHWLKQHSDNIWTALVVGMGTIIFDDEVIVLFGGDLEKHHSLVYLMGGPLSDRLRILFIKQKS